MNVRSATMRWGPMVIGLLLFAFGLASLNYTKAETFQHHQEWARERGVAAPSNTIFWGGVGSAVLGAFVLGFSLARRMTGRPD